MLKNVLAKCKACKELEGTKAYTKYQRKTKKKTTKKEKG